MSQRLRKLLNIYFQHNSNKILDHAFNRNHVYLCQPETGPRYLVSGLKGAKCVCEVCRNLEDRFQSGTNRSCYQGTRFFLIRVPPLNLRNSKNLPKTSGCDSLLKSANKRKNS